MPVDLITEIWSSSEAETAVSTYPWRLLLLLMGLPSVRCVYTWCSVFGGRWRRCVEEDPLLSFGVSFFIPVFSDTSVGGSSRSVFHLPCGRVDPSRIPGDVLFVCVVAWCGDVGLGFLSSAATAMAADSSSSSSLREWVADARSETTMRAGGGSRRSLMRHIQGLGLLREWEGGSISGPAILAGSQWSRGMPRSRGSSALNFSCSRVFVVRLQGCTTVLLY